MLFPKMSSKFFNIYIYIYIYIYFKIKTKIGRGEGSVEPPLLHTLGWYATPLATATWGWLSLMMVALWGWFQPS
jgi:hypothetical protein